MGTGASNLCGHHPEGSAVNVLQLEEETVQCENDGKIDDEPCSTTIGDEIDSGCRLSSGDFDSITDFPLECGRSGQIVAEAIAKAEQLMEDYDILEAEAVLVEALKELEDNAEACTELRQAPVFKSVSDRVAQYDALSSMLTNPNMKTLWESEDGKFELHQEQGTWFDYKMTLNIDAPLSECVATGHELDLVPKAQPLVSGTEKLGPCGKFLMVTLMKLSVVLFRVELLFEVLRVRNKKFGFLAESIRSSFPANGRHIPEKGWRSVRPWVYTANLWMPRGGGQPGTVLVQVTRVDCGLNVPQCVLNFVFRQMASTFMSDLRNSAARAQEAGSPWATRIAEDESGLYRDLRDLETAAQHRRTVTAQTFPGSEVFDRPSRLMPEPVDTRPPSSR